MTEAILPSLDHGRTANPPSYDKDSAYALSLGSSSSRPLYANSENVLEPSSVYLDRAGFLGRGPDILPWCQTNGTVTLTAQELFGGVIACANNAGTNPITLPPIQEVLGIVDYNKIPVSDVVAQNETRFNYKVFASFRVLANSTPTLTLRAPAASTIAGHAGTSGYRSYSLTNGAVANLAAAANTIVLMASYCVFYEKGADGMVWGYIVTN